MEKQKTIAREASVSGIGLHTANKVKVTFKPAPAGSGIAFLRRDIPGAPLVKVSVENLLFTSGSPRRTSLKKDGVEVHTIEHLMAALSGLGIDNLLIEMDNSEVPGLDGSSLSFLELLAAAGISDQEKEKDYLAIREPVFIEEGGAVIVAVPCAELKISYNLDYRHPFLKSQFLEIVVNPETFKEQLCGARTFCLEEEAEQLRQHGLGLGADYNNTLVVGKSGVIKNKLRFEDEFIRHKMLDLVGDLFVLGQPLKAHLIALRSGHALNLKLVKKIDQQRQKTLSGGIGAGYLTDAGSVLSAEEIMQILPHRHPFLFVDRIVELEKGVRAVGIKNVTINDYFFKGHFPGRPVMPGVLMIEAMAQVGGIMMLSPEENRGKLAFFMAANNVKFRKTVVPGDQLVMEVVAGKIKSRTGQVHGKCMVEGKVVVEADLMFALVE